MFPKKCLMFLHSKEPQHKKQETTDNGYENKFECGGRILRREQMSVKHGTDCGN